MKAFVFTDESLRAEAGRFVWLAIDTEKEENAPVQERFPIDAWPTLLVVDPKEERVALRWVGAATVPQLKRILDDGAAAVSGKGSSSIADAGFERAERAYAARDFAAAAKEYQAALAGAPAEWPRHFRAVESLLFALTRQQDCATTLTVVREHLPRLRQAPSALSLSYSGLSCALDLPQTDPARPETILFFENAAREAIADPKVAAAADDRSGVLARLIDARKAAKDEPGAKRAAADWTAFLEAEARRAKTPQARTVFDSHLLSASLAMGAPERAVPWLQRSERDFPGDYNPPARLAVAYKEMKRWDDALAAADRALKLAYGPRTLRILSTRADVQLAKGDKAGARATLERALATAHGLPPPQRSERTIEAVRKRIAELDEPAL
jgi:tetratricopeptide (TPR) repeat protein